MRCFYINLDAATQRRRSLEENFAQTRKEDWSLTRIDAIDAAYVEANAIGGSSTAPEKACFLSHGKALRESMNDDEAAFILEDDAILGRDTCNIVEQLPSFAKDLAWDIVARFAGPGVRREFAGDWAGVAAEEAEHFALLAARLSALSASYGDLSAHDALWEAAAATTHDLLSRTNWAGADLRQLLETVMRGQSPAQGAVILEGSDVLLTPNTASTSPEASIGSRTGKPTFSNFMLASSSLLTDLKIGHWA